MAESKHEQIYSAKTVVISLWEAEIGFHFIAASMYLLSTDESRTGRPVLPQRGFLNSEIVSVIMQTLKYDLRRINVCINYKGWKFSANYLSRLVSDALDLFLQMSTSKEQEPPNWCRDRKKYYWIPNWLFSFVIPHIPINIGAHFYSKNLLLHLGSFRMVSSGNHLNPSPSWSMRSIATKTPSKCMDYRTLMYGS